MRWPSIIGRWRSRSSGSVRAARAPGRGCAGQAWEPRGSTGGLEVSAHRRQVRLDGEGGLRLSGLPDGSRVVVATVNRTYELDLRGGQVWISGHPHLCPRPVRVRVRGSSWGGSMLRIGYLGPGMRMEFEHPSFRCVTTSRIVSVSRER